MSMTYDLIIVGAGPSGLYAACHVDQNRRVLLLEKNHSPGRKLLLSGSGQCNFTNSRPIREFLNCYGGAGRFLRPALLGHTNQDVINFFQAHQIPINIIPVTGKVFPKSGQAQTILDCLLRQCQQNKVEIHYQEATTEIIKHDDLFVITTTKATYQSHAVLLATGGQSYPKTGSTGDGYRLAQSLGHTIVPPHPGLTPFDISHHPFCSLAGTSFKNLPVSLYHRGKKIKTLVGDMVITHTGLSGPVIHNLSRHAQKHDHIKLHFFKSVDEELCQQHWQHLLAAHSRQPASPLLRKLGLTKATSQLFIKIMGINPLSKLAELSKKECQRLYHHLLGFDLVLKNKGDFNIAMITVGGITLNEINAKTMGSKLASNLYFCGELMDIDGDTGGYDLQACWSTGYLASQSLFLKK